MDKEVRPRLRKWELSYMLDCIDGYRYHFSGETKNRLTELENKLKRYLEKLE